MPTTIGVVDLPPSPASGAPALRALAARRFAGTSLLEWVARRVTEVLAVDETMILLCNEHAELQELAPTNINVHVSSRNDSLAALVELCDVRQANAVVRMSVDTPFVDPVLVDQLICTANDSGCDYATYCSCDERSPIQARLGLVAEWITADALRRADQEAVDERRDQPTRHIWTHPERYCLKFIPVPKPLDREDLRLVINSEEDWDHAHQIFDALGPEDIDWQRIAVLLAEQPGIRKRMAALNQAAS